jgi:CrcB protein
MLVIYIFIGGGIGSVLRYFVIGSFTRNFGINFPYGTLAVNIMGSFLMGVLIEYLTRTLPHSIELRAFLAVGILGGFTTFSAFSMDAITLFERGEPGYAMVYVLASVILSICAVFAGLMAVKSCC